MALRSGRFKFNGAATQPILTGKKNDSLLRVFNSGRDSFIVKDSGGSAIHTLDPMFSVDVNGDSGGISIEIAGDKVAEGIYDYLTPHHDIRSGRFDTSNPVGGASNPLAYVKIADLSGLGEQVYYRFFNSGETTIAIYIHDKLTQPTNAANSNASLAANQSIDLSISKNSKRTIWVRTHPDHEGTSNDNPIQGIYDFLDIDD